MKARAGVLVAVLAGALTLTGRADLINPGFETGDFTGWSTFGQGWRLGTGGDANSGTYGAVDDVLTTDVDDWRGIYQEVSVVGGDTYNVSVYIRAVNVESSESWLELQWLDASHSVISQLQTAHVTADQSFTRMALDGVIAPVNAVGASVRGIVNMTSAPTGDNDFHIFDNFEVVPEPGSAAMLLLGGLVIARRALRRARMA